jgi:hypothetical protein
MVFKCFSRVNTRTNPMSCGADVQCLDRQPLLAFDAQDCKLARLAHRGTPSRNALSDAISSTGPIAAVYSCFDVKPGARVPASTATATLMQHFSEKKGAGRHIEHFQIVRERPLSYCLEWTYSGA